VASISFLHPPPTPPLYTLSLHDALPIWQQPRLAEHLEAVADPEDPPAPLGEVDHRPHHRREPGDRAGAQVVAVGEPAGDDHRLTAAQVLLGVPQHDRLLPEPPDREQRVAVVTGPREPHDTDAHAPDPTVGPRPAGHENPASRSAASGSSSPSSAAASRQPGGWSPSSANSWSQTAASTCRAASAAAADPASTRR